MPVLIRIAFRNMWEHKAKSLIIGILVALGVVVIVLGNAMMDAAAKGVRETFIESFTGDIMIHGPSENAISIFGVESMDMSADAEVPTIPDFDQAIKIVRENRAIASATSMATAYGMVAMDAEETIEDAASGGDAQSNMIFGIVFGVDASTYFDMFPSITVTEGRTLRPGEIGVMLTKNQMERLAKKYKREFKVGDNVLINGIAVAGMRIRETEIVGVYQREENAAAPAPFIFTDIDTARVLGGLTLGGDEEIVLDAAQTAYLEAVDLDSLFNDDSFGEISAAPQAATVAFSNAADLLGDTSKREMSNTADAGAWNFILVRLKDSGSSIATAAAIAELKAAFDAANLDVRVVDWKGAAGFAGQMADNVRTIFYIALIIIAIVAVIVMMNTLVVSVIERTSEIGTMRALGAQRSFVRAMFLTETLTLTVVFGLIGSALTLLFVLVMNALKIPAGDGLLKLLFGGEVFHLVPTVGSFLSTIVMVFIVGYIAHLYPVSVALKIQPVKAMQTE